MKYRTIAIDGFSACGKSTLAKALAKCIEFSYVDTGAMYRAVSLYFIKNKLDLNNNEEINHALKAIHIHFENIMGQNTCLLNGKNVEKDIRNEAVNAIVSEVAAISKVRRKMVQQQREMGSKVDLVMDGRDIATVVFPKADLKLFLTAEEEIRTKRRLLEYKTKGVDIDFDQVLANLRKRDHIDSTRADSPLKKDPKAIEIDNSYLNETEQLELVIGLTTAKKII